MNPLDELYQKVEYFDGEITILDLFIKDPVFFRNNCGSYEISQISRLFLISHQIDLSFNYYCTPDMFDKLIKYNNIADEFIKAYNNFIVAGFSFNSIIKYTYTEFYTISSIIDAVHNKKYFWRRINKSSSKKLFANINTQTLCLTKTKEEYSLIYNYMCIHIPSYLFQYIDEYIEKSHRITHKKIIVSGMLYRSEKDRQKYLEQQRKRYERQQEREKQIEIVQREKGKATSEFSQEISEEITPDNSVKPENNTNNFENNINKTYQIKHNDFIIRCTIFQCSFKQHLILDIDASIDIMDISTNNTTSMIVPAGYCSNCNRYFIMDSTYNKIFTKGLPLCKIIDKRDKLSKSKFILNPEKWGAQESILKQYGYSVSAIDNLSDAKRQKILAVIIDIEALTKVEIIGYLRYFIKIHKSDLRFEKAISKWNSDIEFIEEYNKGHYTTYKVSGLKKNW